MDKGKDSKKQLLLVASIILSVALIVAVGFITAGNATNGKVEDQLELGARYLSELDYEKAIAAYEAVIEIDAKNVEAYLGLADVYVEMKDYGAAIEVLSAGLEMTQDGSLVDALEEVQRLIEQAAESKDNLTVGEATEQPVELEAQEEIAEVVETEALDPRFEACVVDGIYHNGYELYDLTEDEESLLAFMIQLAGEENWEGVFEALHGEQLLGVMENHDRLYGEGSGSINIAFHEYKVQCIFEPTRRAVVLIPLNEGSGYYFTGCYGPTYQAYGGAVEYQTVMVSGCKNGMFDGEFTYTESMYNFETRKLLEREEITGGMINGLLNGAVKYHNYNFYDAHGYRLSEFKLGKPEVLKMESIGEGLDTSRCYISYKTDENWNPIIDEFGEYEYCRFIEQASIDTFRYVMPYHRTPGYEIDGDMHYYSW